MPNYDWNLETFLEQFDFPRVNVIDDYILLGDSILRFVGNINNTQVLAYPGMGLIKMEVLIRNNKVPEINNKKMIIIHLGTNDASKKSVTVPTMMDMTDELITAIRDKAPFAKIVISHIIPRPCDFAKSNSKIMEYNKAVHARASLWGISTIPTYETLQYEGKPIETFFLHRDKLHLSDTGIPRVRMALSKGIAKERLKAGFKRTKRKAPETIIRECLATRLRKAKKERNRKNVSMFPRCLRLGRNK